MSAFPTELEQLITDAAQRHALPPKLVHAVVQKESSGNPWSTRYEPGFYTRYIAGKNVVHPRPPCSQSTEATLMATSFGLMQVMGATARDLGFDGTFLTALCDPFTGLEYGCRYLRSLIQRYGWDQRAGVAAYNAGSAVRKPDGTFKNQDYVDAIAKFGGF